MKTLLLCIFGLWMTMPRAHANPVCKLSWINVNVDSNAVSVSSRSMLKFKVATRAIILVSRDGSLAADVTSDPYRAIHSPVFNGGTMVRVFQPPGQSLTVDVEGPEAGRSPRLASGRVTARKWLNLNAGHLNVSCISTQL